MIVKIIRAWNTKYDIFSIISDFIFVFGVLVLDWSPILLFFLLIVDTSLMLFFVNILFFLEYKDPIRSIGFLITSGFLFAFLFIIYYSIMDFIEEVELENYIHADPWQIINSYVFPLVLVSSYLNHHAEFRRSIYKMKHGNYNSSFIKHFFKRYLFIMGLALTLVFTYAFFNLTIVIALISIKVLIRLWNKKFREIL